MPAHRYRFRWQQWWQHGKVFEIAQAVNARAMLCTLHPKLCLARGSAFLVAVTAQRVALQHLFYRGAAIRNKGVAIFCTIRSPRQRPRLDQLPPVPENPRNGEGYQSVGDNHR
jgi:hypothetical protein